MKVMIKPQGQIDHKGNFGDDLGAAAETGDKMTNVAVVRLDGERQVFAGEELILRNEAVKPSQSSARKVLPWIPTLSRSV
ncbi:MAG: hypothetical protein JO007_13445 [Alphaproteobacteria bacterium]|nr:hypothetical protein [Alphaproteobacteria bacterium]